MNEETIRDTIRDNLKNFICQPNKIACKKMKTEIENSMSNLIQNNQIKNGTVITKTLWRSWTIMQKIKWIFLNYLKFGQKQIDTYNKQKQAIENTINSILDTLKEKIIPDELQAELTEELSSIVSDFELECKPWFIESCPKTVVLADVYFVPVKPLSYIKATFKLNKEIPS